MIRVVLIVACICLILSLGSLPFNLHDKPLLVVNVMAVAASAALGALAMWRLYVHHRSSVESQDDS